VTRHVHARSNEPHTFTTQPRAMPRKCGEAVRPHDPLERYVRLVAVPERVAYGPRRTRPSSQLANKSVCRHAPWRDTSDDRVHRAAPCFRGHVPHHGRTL